MSNILNMIRSAKQCDIRLLDKELEQGADINGEGYNLLINSIVFNSCYGHNRDYMDFLIKNNIDINQTTQSGRTALHFASIISRYDAVQYLVEHDIDINAVSAQGYNALMEASKGIFLNGVSDISREKEIFLSYYEAAGFGEAYARQYMNRRNRKELLKNQLNILKYLIESGIDIGQTSIDNDTAMDLAIENYYIGNTSMVKVLKSYKVPMNKNHHRKFDLYDELFEGGLAAFLSDSYIGNLRKKKIRVAEKGLRNK